MLFIFLVILLVSSLSSANYDFRCTDDNLCRSFPASLRRATITIATETDASPFVSRIGNGVPFGFDIDLMNLISFIWRIPFHYRFLPPQSLIPAVQSNVNTVSISSAAITDARMKLVDFAQFIRVGNAFMVKSTYTGSINGPNDLCGKKVSVLAGSIQETDVQAQKKSCPSSSPLTIVSVMSLDDLTNNVLNGSADVSVAEEITLLQIASESNNQLKVVGVPYNIRPYGIMCNKKNRGLCCALVDAINYLIEEGVYQQLLERYSFSYRNNGICPSRINLNGTTCSSKCTPDRRTCNKYLG